MALYDDASFIFLASAAAGQQRKDLSKTYSVKPVPSTTGSELVTNGTFDSDSSWTVTNTASISGGKCTFTDTSGAGVTNTSSACIQDSIFDSSGKTYRISFTFTHRSGQLRVGTSHDSDIITGVGDSLSESGRYTFYYTATSSSSGFDKLRFQRNNGTGPYDFDIDDISVFVVDTAPADFDISRDANLDATRVGPTGLIEKGRENKFLYSNNFSKNIGTWGHNGLSSVIGIHNDLGQEGYDGTNNASYIRANTNNGVHKVLLSAQAGVSVSSQAVQTISIHAKPLGYTFLAITTQSGNQEAYFDLANGTVGTTESDVIEAKITPAGNGYFRCSMTVNADIAITQINFNIALEDNNHSFTGDPNRGGTDNGGIFIQDAQWELGLVPTEIISSNGSAGTAGIKEDEPRFDYPVAGGAPSLLIEPQRQNLMEHSEYMASYDFSTSRVNVTSNHGISPEGVKNSTLVSNTTETGNKRLYGSNAFSVTSGTSYTASVFAKKGTLKKISMEILSSSESTIGFDEAMFDLDAGTVSYIHGSSSTSDALIEDFGNGWFRCSITDAPTSTESSARLYIYFLPDDATTAGDKNYTGSTSENVELFGAQVEEGASATSYIPTHGATATRSTDNVAALDTSGFSFGTTCTIFFEGVINEPTASHVRPVTMFGSHGSPTTAERYLLFGGTFSGSTYTLTSKHNTTPSSSLVETSLTKAGLTIGAKVKCASVFSGTSFKFFVNGALADSGGTATVTAASIFNSLDLSQITGDQNHAVGSIILWGSAVSNLDALVLTDTNYGSYSEMVNSLSYTQHG